MSYNNILVEFLANSKEKSSLNNAIKILFDKAREYDELNGIREVFAALLKNRDYDLSINNVTYMLELGADPSTIDDPFVCRSIRRFKNDGPEILSVLMDHGLNINSAHCNEYWFVQKMAYLKILIDKGYNIQTIFNLINQNEPEDCEGAITDFIVDRLRKAEYIPDNNSLHLLFETALFSGRLTCDDIDLFVDLGLNLRYDNDLFLMVSCKCENVAVTNYLINYGLDVNTQFGKPLLYAMICRSHPNIATVKLLLDHNAQVLDSHIISALQSKELVDLFINRGVSCEKIAVKYLEKIMHQANDLDIGKMLVSNGVDFDQLIMSHEKKIDIINC